MDMRLVWLVITVAQLVPVSVNALTLLTGNDGATAEFSASQHHDTQQLLDALTRVHQRCPDITRLHTVGTSVEGRPLAAIEFSANPGVHRIRESLP